MRMVYQRFARHHHVTAGARDVHRCSAGRQGRRSQLQLTCGLHRDACRRIDFNLAALADGHAGTTDFDFKAFRFQDFLPVHKIQKLFRVGVELPVCLSILVAVFFSEDSFLALGRFDPLVPNRTQHHGILRAVARMQHHNKVTHFRHHVLPVGQERHLLCYGIVPVWVGYFAQAIFVVNGAYIAKSHFAAHAKSPSSTLLAFTCVLYPPDFV